MLRNSGLTATTVAVRNAHARGDLGLVDVEHRATLDQAIHENLPRGRINRTAAREGLMRWSLNLAIKEQFEAPETLASHS